MTKLDPRVQIAIEDGRNALSQTDERFDIIEADALRPTSAFAGNLYSTEFFGLVADRLRPGGVVRIWSDEYDVMLLDIKMPGTSGIEGLKVATEMRPERLSNTTTSSEIIK